MASDAQSGMSLYVLLALVSSDDFSCCAPISFSGILEVGGGVQIVSLPPEEPRVVLSSGSSLSMGCEKHGEQFSRGPRAVADICFLFFHG